MKKSDKILWWMLASMLPGVIIVLWGLLDNRLGLITAGGVCITLALSMFWPQLALLKHNEENHGKDKLW